MKNLFFAASLYVLSFSAFAEDSTKVIHKSSDSDSKESSVLIQTTKGAKMSPDFEIISGTEEVTGDPTSGMKEALKSWKEACAEWKKELKENNKENQVLIASCGSKKFAQDEAAGAGSGIYTYRSEATYKIRVRIKDR
jgi:hypothetical protein